MNKWLLQYSKALLQKIKSITKQKAGLTAFNTLWDMRFKMSPKKLNKLTQAHHTAAVLCRQLDCDQDCFKFSVLFQIT